MIICYVSNVISEYYIYKTVANISFASERHALGFRSGVVVRYVLPSCATVCPPSLPIQAAPGAVSDNINPLVCEYSGLLVYRTQRTEGSLPATVIWGSENANM